MKTLSILIFCLFGLFNGAYSQKSALLWSTYFEGDTSFNSSINYLAGAGVCNVTTDDSGNVYIIGLTYNLSGLATKGAYQTIGDSVNGDAFLAKFTSSGNLLWATYYGGSGEENGLAVTIDKSGGVYISGYTSSSSGIATSGGYQTSFGGGTYDGFLAKFSTSGNFLWGTYFGGTKEDQCSGIITDKFGNIYISGYSLSSSGIATKGAYHTSLNGISDAFLAKFNSSGGIIWATYFGGNRVDDAWNLATDISGYIYLTGLTASTSGLATSGAYKTLGDTTGGVIFLAKFSPSDSLIWATYFGGNGDNEDPGVATDKLNNIYLTGSTRSTSGIATAGAYQTYNAGDYDAFLAKFNAKGKLIWSTYYGGGGFEQCYNDIVDSNGNIYLAGYTSSLSGISTKGAYQVSNAGYDDAFLAEFSPSGNLVLGTYLGGSGDDYGFNLAPDPYGNVYIAGETYSYNKIATSGAYQTRGDAADGAGFIAKFNIHTYQNDAGISAILNPSNSFCEGFETLKVQIKNYGTDTLKSAKIGWNVNGANEPAKNWTGSIPSGGTDTFVVGIYHFSPGNYTMKSWTSLPNGKTDSFPGNDTTTITIVANPLPQAFVGRDSITMCEGDFLVIGDVGYTGHIYNWVSKPAGFTSTATDPLISPTVNTTYTLTETDTLTGCKKSHSVSVTVEPAMPQAHFKATKIINFEYTFIAADTSFPTYTWNMIGNDIGVDSLKESKKHDSIDVKFIFPGTFDIKLTETNKYGCTSSFDTTIVVGKITVGIKNDENIPTITLSPNPFTTLLALSASGLNSTEGLISVCDMQGRQVFSKNCIFSKDMKDELNLSTLPAGMYFLKITTAQEQFNFKAIKQ